MASIHIWVRREEEGSLHHNMAFHLLTKICSIRIHLSLQSFDVYDLITFANLF